MQRAVWGARAGLNRFQSMRSSQALFANTQRFAGGFNSKFDFEKKWDERHNDDNPFYAYDPNFTNTSLVRLTPSLSSSLIPVPLTMLLSRSTLMMSWTPNCGVCKEMMMFLILTCSVLLLRPQFSFPLCGSWPSVSPSACIPIGWYVFASRLILFFYLRSPLTHVTISLILGWTRDLWSYC